MHADPEIMKSSLSVKCLFSDNSEAAAAGLGVLRDAYSSFWTEFYDRSTLGITLKVPFLKHNFNVEKWKVVCRIFLKVFQDCKYFPIKLASFLEETLFGAVYSRAADFSDRNYDLVITI